MDLEKELTEAERRFWLGDATYYREKLAPEALMILPEPAGILDRASVIASIEVAQRWKVIGITDVSLVPLSFGAVGFVYRAQARREADGPPYAALCTSVYVRKQGVWKMATHQQTPIGP